MVESSKGNQRMANSRDKGKRGEFEVRELLKAVLTPVYKGAGVQLPEFERNLEQVRAGGADINGIDWLVVEVKRQEKVNLKSWWSQVKAATRPGQVPLLMWRQNNQPWRAMVEVSILLYDHQYIPLAVQMEMEEWSHWIRWECWNRLKVRNTNSGNTRGGGGAREQERSS